MRTDDIRIIRASARRIIQRAAEIRHQEMRFDIGVDVAIIINLCNRAITASGEPDPLRRYFEGNDLFLPWPEAEPERPAGIMIQFPIKDDDPG